MRKYSGKLILNTAIILSALIVLTYLFYVLFFNKDRTEMVYINEVCSSNLRAYKDENGDNPDYIELYNGDDHDIDLSEWRISESRESSKGWELPEVIIPSGGYIIINADDTERKIYPDEQYFSVRKFVMTGEGYVPEDTGLHAGFSLPSKGTELFLSDSHDNLIDSIEIPELRYDTVYARTVDGGPDLERMTPTPGETNGGSEMVVLPTLAEPVFSAESGFYDDAFMLSITSPDGGEIRYTTDGSTPDRDSALYEGPIRIDDASENENVYCVNKNLSVYLYDYYLKKDFRIPDEKVDKCNVIRAAVFSGDGKVSKTVTKSYFVGFKDKEMYDGIKVMSLVSDPDQLFGSKEGIFVLGDIGVADLKERYEESEEASKVIKENPDLPLDGSVKIGDVGYNRGSDGNYMQHGIDWERETDMTLFSNDHGSIVMQQAAGLRIKGNSSRQYPLKGLNLYARKAYSGKDHFDASFLGDVTGESSISLSAGGTDRYTMTKDAFVSERIRDTGLDVAAGRFGEPVYVFLDGEFWGAYVIAERLKEEFFSQTYGVRKDNVIFIKEGEVEAGVKDDIHYYYVFLSLYEDKDFSNDDEYAEFCDAVDIESLIDYYSMRIFSEYGLDWPHLNYGFWRTRESEESPYGDCRWRFVNFDNNAALSYENINVDMMDVLYNGSRFFGKDELFTRLMENEEFKERFEKRYGEVVEKVFCSKNAEDSYNRISDVMRIPVSSSYNRWYGSENSYGEDLYNEETRKIGLFLKERGSLQGAYLK